MDEAERIRRINLLKRLSPREFEIFRLTREGVRDVEVATRLFISVSTVELHYRAIANKLGIAGHGPAEGRLDWAGA